MKFSYNWIRELVPGLAEAAGPLERLITMKTAECEGIEEAGALLREAVPARVESVEPIERTIVPTLGAIFYVNNAAKNVDGTRYQQVVHVHLGHGDSDKPASYASSTTMFDRIFVAGQAGVDRFASHGVLTHEEKFVLVGRPQVEAIDVRPAGAALPPWRSPHPGTCARRHRKWPRLCPRPAREWWQSVPRHAG